MTEKLRDILIALLGASVVVGGSTFLITRHFCNKNVKTNVGTKIENTLDEYLNKLFPNKDSAVRENTARENAATAAKTALDQAEATLKAVTDGTWVGKPGCTAEAADLENHVYANEKAYKDAVAGATTAKTNAEKDYNAAVTRAAAFKKFCETKKYIEVTPA